jgi:hypothetical protein
MAYGTGFSYGKTGTALPKKEKLRKSDNQSFGHLGMVANERGRSSGAQIQRISPSGSSISSR